MRRRPKQQCGYVFWAAGPHDGCAEFSAEQPIECWSPATHVYRYRAPWDGDVTEREFVCTFHAAVLRRDVYQPKVYRYRTIK